MRGPGMMTMNWTLLWTTPTIYWAGVCPQPTPPCNPPCTEPPVAMGSITYLDYHYQALPVSPQSSQYRQGPAAPPITCSTFITSSTCTFPSLHTRQGDGFQHQHQHPLLGQLRCGVAPIKACCIRTELLTLNGYHNPWPVTREPSLVTTKSVIGVAV